MRFQRMIRWVASTSVVFVMVCAPALTNADRRARRSAPPKDARQVEFFKAMDDGDIEVTFIPKDSTEATVIVKNKTDKPLTIAVPAAFAGVPVLAQFGGGGFGGGGMGGMGGGGMGGGGMGGGGQGLGGGGMGGMGGGGGMGMGGMGGGGFGGGGGFFNVAAEKVHKVKVPCVCLEHGKPDPTPRMKYTIVPLEKLNKDPKVAELCKMLGQRQIPQNAAQAAAWNLANGMSWQQLAAKNRVESKYLGTQKFFSRQELMLAFRIAGFVTHRTKDETESTEQSPGETTYRTGQNQQAGG